MIRNDFRYMMEFSRKDGTAVGQMPVTFDWEPAAECLRWSALRRGYLPAADVTVSPLWHATLGQPYVAGAEVAGDDISDSVPLDYFAGTARRLSSDFVEKGLLKDGEVFVYKVSAFPGCAAPVSAGAEDPFTVREVVTALPVKEAGVGGMLRDAVAFGEGTGDDPPVVIPQLVLDETASLARAAGAVETGGILIGHLCREPGATEIAAVVTAQIPARHTEAGLAKLTFTSDTWTAVRAALDLRKSGELMLGWWHSHPSFSWCGAECPLEKRKICAAQKAFLSADDVLLHRTIFVKSYSLALLVNNADAGLEHALFGWRRGVVRSRGFHVTNGSEPGQPPVAAPTTGDTHAQGHAEPSE